MAQYSWESSRITGDIARILLEERLGVSVNLSIVLGGSHLGPPALAGGLGCAEDDGFSGCNVGAPLAHFVLDSWGGGVKSYLLMNSSIQPVMGDMGYTGFEGTFVPDSAVQLGLSMSPRVFLDFYKSYDAQDGNLSRFLATRSEVEAKITELGLQKAACTREEIPQAFAGCAFYEAATGDFGLYTWMDGECHLSCQEDWIESPACRSNPSTCVAWVTTGDGWGVEEMLQQAVFWNIPLAVVVLPEWSDYTTLPLEVPSLWFWFFPDPSFMALNPIKLQEPSTDDGERAARIFRTGADRIVLKKFIWQLLSTFAPQVHAFIDNIQFSQGDVTTLMQNASLGQDLHEIACQWVRENEHRWNDWLPLPDACAPGWAFNEDEGRCTRCLPGSYSLGVGSNVPSCEVCPKGKFGADVGGSACAHCEVGHFSDARGRTVCGRCPSGTFAEVEGRSECQWCSAGEEQPLWNTLRRLVDVAGGEQWVQIDGASHADDCGCNFGARWADNSNGTRCVLCGTEGMECVGKGEIRILPGYMSDTPISIFKCYGQTRRCVGGIPGQTCKEGRTGTACGECESGKRAADDGHCKTCAGSDIVPVVGVVAALLLVLAAVYNVVDSRVQEASAPSQTLMMCSIALGQLVGVIQQLSVVAYFNVTYEEPLQGFVQFFALLAFDYEMLNLSCVHRPSASLRYSMKILCFLACGVFVCLLHCIYVLVWYHARFKERMPALTSAMGMIMLGVFTSLVVIVMGPFQCNKHPNGQYTMAAYEDAICWDLDTHTEQRDMIAIGAVTFCAPVSFFVYVCYLAIVFPRRMKELDVSFVKSYGTIFLRFRAGAHWYVTAVLTRSMLIALIPVIRDPVFQIFILQIILLVSLSLSYIVQPWRLPLMNYLDAFFTLALVNVANLAAFVVVDVDTHGIGYFVVIMLAVAISSVPTIVIVAVWKKVSGTFRKPFQFFICHAKAQTGSFARLLKLDLLECSRVRREVFLDSDNLEDLDKLLSHIIHDVETLVVLLSRSTLFRPWCIGEVSAAYVKGVPSVGVQMPTFEHSWTAGAASSEGLLLETTSAIGSRASMKDALTVCLVECSRAEALAEAGLDADVIIEALSRMELSEKLVLPKTIAARHIQALARTIAEGKRKGSITVSAPHMGEVETEPEVLLIADSTASESVAAAGVVQKLLGKRLVSNAAGMVMGVSIMEGDIVPERTQVAVLICTEGCLLLGPVVRALIDCGNRNLPVLPIVCEEHFRYPSASLFATLNEDILPPVTSEDAGRRTLKDVHAQLENLCQDVFKEIAITMRTSSASLAMLNVAIDTAASRIMGATVHKMRVKSATSATPDGMHLDGAQSRSKTSVVVPAAVENSSALPRSGSSSPSGKSTLPEYGRQVSKRSGQLASTREASCAKDESHSAPKIETGETEGVGSPHAASSLGNVEKQFSFDC